ncbi:MAG: 3-methyl-2-oxobutanoate hydroxymethyltransferase [Deltaproteobacteria bacterium]|nr:MAG: 3-methyl-2-oxobutanoate hydroxymethyltransferase [Deltaproteobacteria bacterium]
MSSHAAPKNVLTIPKVQKKKVLGEKITMVTCYDATFAKLVDAAGIDLVLVGDSLGMVIQGQKNTLPVTLNDMIYHTAAVSRGLSNPVIIADMPFMSYQAEFGVALKNAGTLMKKGNAHSVKIEGGMEVAELAYRMSRVGIPVMGHIGLEPQKVHSYGGFKVRGKALSEERKLIKDAKALEEAGCWSLVIEGVPSEVADKITQAVTIPTIGIGSGPGCDGQVLVLYDLLGLDPSFKPKFVKKYVDLATVVTDALKSYVDEVKTKQFPADEHQFHRLALVTPLKKKVHDCFFNTF